MNAGRPGRRDLSPAWRTMDAERSFAGRVSRGRGWSAGKPARGKTMVLAP